MPAVSRRPVVAPPSPRTAAGETDKKSASPEVGEDLGPEGAAAAQSSMGNEFVKSQIAARGKGKGPFDDDLINGALSEAFGESLDGVSAGWDAGANKEIGADASTKGSAMSFGAGISENPADPKAMEVIAHETAHALAGGGSGEVAVDEGKADKGEQSAEKAGVQFRQWAEAGFEGPAPTLTPAEGGKAEIHRHRRSPTPTLTGVPALRQGTDGALVRVLQQALNKHGANLDVDGDFGKNTARAVRKFQGDHGLEVDGVVGPASAAKLTGGGGAQEQGGGNADQRDVVPTDPNERLVYLIGNGGRRLGMVERQNEWMLPRTAAAFDEMNALARQHGVTLTIKDGFRSYREQVDIANRLGLYSQGGLAAEPGTSRHGLGVALDLNDGREYAWLYKYAPRFGFTRTVPREPWHWEV